MTDQPFKGKLAIITGASRGIGLAIAKALAEQGCTLALSSRKATDIRGVARRLASSAPVLAEACDVRDPRSVDNFFRAIKRQFSRVDFLINNAGIAHQLQPVEKLPAKVWRDVIDTNLNGMFFCTRGALPLMRRGGVIVNNLSIAAQRVFPGMSAYDASKHGALGLTDTLREELRERGIRVLALIPGATATDIWDQFMPDADRKTMMSPESVSSAVVHALTLPPDSAIEEIRMLPLSGTSRT